MELADRCSYKMHRNNRTQAYVFVAEFTRRNLRQFSDEELHTCCNGDKEYTEPAASSVTAPDACAVPWSTLNRYLPCALPGCVSVVYHSCSPGYRFCGVAFCGGGDREAAGPAPMPSPRAPVARTLAPWGIPEEFTAEGARHTY